MRWFIKKFAAASEPSEEKREFQGIPIVIEWPVGSIRTGVNKDGEPWEREMKADYGYIPDTVGSDGDGEDLDIYVGPDPTAPTAFLIEQLDDEGELDEYKCMIGYATEDAALSSYLDNYPEGWEDHVGDVWDTPVSRIRELLAGDEGKYFREGEVRKLGKQYRVDYPEMEPAIKAYEARRLSHP